MTTTLPLKTVEVVLKYDKELTAQLGRNQEDWFLFEIHSANRGISMNQGIIQLSRSDIESLRKLFALYTMTDFSEPNHNQQ